MGMPDMATLNSTQLVLRGVTQSLAAAGLIDPGKVAYLLQAFAASHTQDSDPIATQMLLDLAKGMEILAQARGQTGVC